MKQAAKIALHAFGYYRRRLEADPYGGVAVLAYHGVRDDRLPAGSLCFENLHVSAATLASHCECLRALRCSVLSLVEWLQIARGERPLPARAVMLTFDDGYRNVLTHGLPVLRRFAIPATVFVCSGPVERQVRFWFDALAARDGEAAVHHAKSLNYADWLNLVERVEMPIAEDDPHAPMNVTELQQLASDPLIAIGAHTATHPILARAPVHVQRDEIVQSRKALETWIGRPVRAFAYPNGRPDVDFTDATVAVLASSGIHAGFTTEPAFADPRATPVRQALRQARFMMLASVTAAELAHRLAVSWSRQPAVAAVAMSPACRAV